MDIEKIIGTIDGNPYELYSLRCFLNELIEAEQGNDNPYITKHCKF